MRLFSPSFKKRIKDIFSLQKIEKKLSKRRAGRGASWLPQVFNQALCQCTCMAMYGCEQ